MLATLNLLSLVVPFLSPAHKVGAGDIVITMSGLVSVHPCFVFGQYLGKLLAPLGGVDVPFVDYDL